MLDKTSLFVSNPHALKLFFSGPTLGIELLTFSPLKQPSTGARMLNPQSDQRMCSQTALAHPPWGRDNINSLGNVSTVLMRHGTREFGDADVCHDLFICVLGLALRMWNTSLMRCSAVHPSLQHFAIIFQTYVTTDSVLDVSMMHEMDCRELPQPRGMTFLTRALPRDRTHR